MDVTEGIDWIHLAQAGFCAQDNEPPNSPKGKELLKQLSYYKLFKVFTRWSN
jgi:hypothetical protein